MAEDHEVFMARRKAAIEFWQTIPEGRWFMGLWIYNRSTHEPCGTVACALGWLAEKQFDGWRWVNSLPCAPIPTRPWSSCALALQGAAGYFGLTVEDATFIFGATDRSGSSGLRERSPQTINEVCAQLLSASVVG